ncbi:MAG: hypothetical protein RMX96_28650 [Nostoc sp. ChiSLP02]|nr:hypothetical protein [Nostoc sp. DedSLP05]MDZ8101654.1 hypothetical protein [Nostoc sp. DedSLP01]MDZ8188809.1 hypothetical protein [Nostoc sp. ChiSLP02]
MAAQNPDPIPPEQAFFDNTYYQILLVDRPTEKNKKITTNILIRTRGDVKQKPQTKENDRPESFNDFLLDEQTVNKLKDYRRKEDDPEDRLSSYLPSPGITFPKAFIDSVFTEKNDQTELGNFYIPMRTLLHARKLSQLIAKTWWSYLAAKEKDLLGKFTAGEWDTIEPDILDGLIAREIFLFGGGEPPNEIENEEVYLPLKLKDKTLEKPRFIISPNSKSWQGISLSLLLAGQAYYKRQDNNKYHQIAQPIFSTGEIALNYSLEVDWNKFTGDIKEIIISNEKPWVAYHAVIPYPPIPNDAKPDEIKEWAYAEDDGEEFPFYSKKDGKYLIDVEYFRSPYSYIPFTCS